jgi:hypothetical protein
MKTFRMFLIVTIVCACAAPLVAQEEEKPPPMVAKNYFLTVNPGQGLGFEAAYKGHLEWHASKNDTWYWHTWQIANGKNLGQYIVRTGGHTWADFDEHAAFSAEDSAHFVENVSGYVTKISSNMVVVDPEISRWPEDYGTPTIVSVNVYQFDREYSRAAYHTIKKIHTAIVEEELPITYSWSRVANGDEGPGPTWILVFPYKSWAEYGESGGDLWKLVEEVYGEYEADLFRKLWSKSYAHKETFIAAYREDLSYNPPE